MRDAFQEKVHLATFEVIPLSVPLNWLNCSVLTPVLAPLSDDIANETPGSNDLQRFTDTGSTFTANEPHATVPQTNPTPTEAGDTQDNMEVDSEVPALLADRDVPVATPVEAAAQSTRPRRENSKKNYSDMVPPSPQAGEEEDTVPQLPNPSVSGKRKNKEITAPRSTRSTSIQLDIRRAQSLPLVVGSRYMKIDVIDLTDLEVSLASTLCMSVLTNICKD